MDLQYEKVRNRSPGHTNPMHTQQQDEQYIGGNSMLWENVTHKRSASDELHRQDDSSQLVLNPEQTMSLKEPLYLNYEQQQQHQQYGYNQEKPIQLSQSAMNERRAMKALSTSNIGSVMGVKRTGSHMATSTSSVQQVLPLKLSDKQKSSSSLSGSTELLNQGITRHGSASSIRTESPERNHQSSLNRSQSSSRAQVTQQLSLQNNRQPPSILPMKLAEKKRPRSASANLGSSQRPAAPRTTSNVSGQDKVLHYYKNITKTSGRHSAPSGPQYSTNNIPSRSNSRAESIADHIQQGPHHQNHHYHHQQHHHQQSVGTYPSSNNNSNHSNLTQPHHDQHEIVFL